MLTKIIANPTKPLPKEDLDKLRLETIQDWNFQQVSSNDIPETMHITWSSPDSPITKLNSILSYFKAIYGLTTSDPVETIHALKSLNIIHENIDLEASQSFLRLEIFFQVLLVKLLIAGSSDLDECAKWDHI